jgi:hypothetical protein
MAIASLEESSVARGLCIGAGISLGALGTVGVLRSVLVTARPR